MKKLPFFIIFLTFGCQKIQQSNPHLSSGAGFVEVEGGKVWYGIMGEGSSTPLLYLHGGPGGTSSSGLNLIDLTDERPVILMDQLGSGFSTFHKDSTLLTLENFVEQVRVVTDELNLNEYYILGESWGATLALEFYLTHQDGVKGIIFSSPFFSSSTWLADTEVLISTLSDSSQQAIAIAKQTGSFSTEPFRDATRAFNQKFFRRTKEGNSGSPSFNLFGPSYDTLSSRWNGFIYNYMWGPSEFNATGLLQNYENKDGLSKVTVPVLFLTGEFDIARPATVQKMSLIPPQGKFKEIPESGHLTLVDNKSKVVQALREFANVVDQEQ